MNNPTKDTILQRIPNLDLRIDSSNQVVVSFDGKRLECGPHGLAILEAFTHPQPLGEAMRTIKANGAQDLAQLMSTMIGLYRAGVLRDPTHLTSAWKADTSGYGATPIHVVMLNDRVRTSYFVAAIQEVIRPGDVVVDIGTGTGVLSIAAAQAGAARVYAIEASGIADIAKTLFAANGVDDRITIVRGWSTQVELPERADVLISEMIGDDPLGENVLSITADAFKRFMKPEARCIPNYLQIFGLPVTVSPGIKVQHPITEEMLQNWSTWYGMDFSPPAEIKPQTSSPAFRYIRPQFARDWPTLSDPVLLAEVDLQSIDVQQIDRTTRTTAQTAGHMDRLLVYFDGCNRAIPQS